MKNKILSIASAICFSTMLSLLPAMPVAAAVDEPAVVLESSAENEFRFYMECSTYESCIKGDVSSRKELSKKFMEVRCITDIQQDGKIVHSLYANDDLFYAPDSDYVRGAAAGEYDSVSVNTECRMTDACFIRYFLPDWYGELSVKTFSPLYLLSYSAEEQKPFVLYAHDGINVQKGDLIGTVVITPSFTGEVDKNGVLYRKEYGGNTEVRTRLSGEIQVAYCEQEKGREAWNSEMLCSKVVSETVNRYDASAFNTEKEFVVVADGVYYHYSFEPREGGAFVINLCNRMQTASPEEVKKLVSVSVPKNGNELMYDVTVVPHITDGEQDMDVFLTSDTRYYAKNNTANYSLCFCGVLPENAEYDILFTPRVKAAPASEITMNSAKIQLPAFSRISGDVNCDGVFAVSDIVCFREYLFGLTDTVPPMSADANHDGVLNAVDFTLMKRRILTASAKG